MPLVEFLDEDGKAKLKDLLREHSETTRNHPIQQQLSQHVRSILESPNEAYGPFFIFAAQMQTGTPSSTAPHSMANLSRVSS